MATITEQLTSLANTKTAIKDAIVAKGVQVADDTPFSGYADKIGEISGGGEPVEKTKFGVGIDNFLGDVDADGNYIIPSTALDCNLDGVKTIPSMAFAYKFCRIEDVVLEANDVIEVGSFAFLQAFSSPQALRINILMSFDSLETINAPYVFSKMLDNRPNSTKIDILFKKLKIVNGDNVFSSFAPTANIDIGSVFPELEEISGNYVFEKCFNFTGTQNLQKVKKITGTKATYNTTFGSFYVKDTVWNFPSATEFTGYIWNVSASYPGEIHFAAANQAAIEACDGYANKWGFAGATIYFDL